MSSMCSAGIYSPHVVKGWRGTSPRATVFIFLFIFLLIPSLVHAETDLNQEIQAKKQRLEELNQKIKEKEQEISAKRSETASLKNQIAIVENRIAQTELSLDATETDIEKTALEISALDKEIDRAAHAIDRNKEYLSVGLRTLARTYEQGPYTALLLKSSISEYFDELRSLTSLQKSVSDSVAEIKTHKENLKKQNDEKGDKRRRLESLRITLDRSKYTLEENKASKRVLVAQNEESARALAKTLSELRSEQQAIDREITSLENSVRAKLQKSDRFRGLGAATGPLRWPVDPARGITTQFHDPEYPFRYIFEHPGIDIRAYQGSEVRAAASGYIAKARRTASPLAYSYILIIHAGGISTVYGHLSSVLVSEDQFVQAGDVIGLSGATPGTPGAGRLTTGPHLHFEVRSSGIPVNPLDYLGS